MTLGNYQTPTYILYYIRFDGQYTRVIFHVASNQCSYSRVVLADVEIRRQSLCVALRNPLSERGSMTSSKSIII